MSMIGSKMKPEEDGSHLTVMGEKAFHSWMDDLDAMQEESYKC